MPVLDEAQDRDSGCAAKDTRARELDLRGLKCPLPVLRTEKAVAALASGAELVVFADDPLAPLDIAHFCRSAGHLLVEARPLGDDAHAFRIRKGPS